MEIDHIYIFSNQQGREAEDLINFGFLEGSSRRHVGQGTINRKFYFENFFLEILWVIDEVEIKSEQTATTKLWERSQFAQNQYSPFGLCLVNTHATDGLFANCEAYQPQYFPQGMSIEMLNNERHPYLPMTFRLPFRDEVKQYNDEFIHHPNQIHRLSEAAFGIPEAVDDLAFVQHFDGVEQIYFYQSEQAELQLEFDHHRQKQTRKFDSLHLTIRY